jgi:hypothetical protein
LKSGNPSKTVIYLRFVRKKEEEEEEEKRWRRTKPKASHGDAPVF